MHDQPIRSFIAQPTKTAYPGADLAGATLPLPASAGIVVPGSRLRVSTKHPQISAERRSEPNLDVIEGDWNRRFMLTRKVE